MCVRVRAYVCVCARARVCEREKGWGGEISYSLMGWRWEGGGMERRGGGGVVFVRV